MSRRALLDTELLLWALAAPARLGREARALLDASDVYVSAASVFEIAAKARQGRVLANAVDVAAALEPSGFQALAVQVAHAARAAALPVEWGDDIDRLLVAQAVLEGMTLVTTDARLAAAVRPVRRVTGAASGTAGRGRDRRAVRTAARGDGASDPEIVLVLSGGRPGVGARARKHIRKGP